MKKNSTEGYENVGRKYDIDLKKRLKEIHEYLIELGFTYQTSELILVLEKYTISYVEGVKYSFRRKRNGKLKIDIWCQLNHRSTFICVCDVIFLTPEIIIVIESDNSFKVYNKYKTQ